MEKLPRVGNVKKAGKLDTFWITGVWWDGKPWQTHLVTSDLTESRKRDEASPFLRRTWSEVIVCDDIWTCDHRSAS